MSLDITIQLGDEDLDHFVEAMQRAQVKAAGLSAQQIVDAASKLLVDVPTTKVPDFIKDRLDKLDQMLQLVVDEGYGLPDEDRKRVLSCLAYFADPQDIIPDNVPVIGFLDDAIMIELCTRELKHELDAYRDFCDYRQREANRLDMDPATIGRADFLEGRREELIDRMRSRRGAEREMGVGYGRTSGWSSGKSYNSWRPGFRR